MANVLVKFKQRVDKYREEADKRADRRLANARTEAERDKVMDSIRKERFESKRKVADARTALLKSEAAKRRAAQEVKDLGGGGFFSDLQKMIGGYSQPKRRTTRRRTTAKKGGTAK